MMLGTLLRRAVAAPVPAGARTAMTQVRGGGDARQTDRQAKGGGSVHPWAEHAMPKTRWQALVLDKVKALRVRPIDVSEPFTERDVRIDIRSVGICGALLA
jgi:hypothetical protein